MILTLKHRRFFLLSLVAIITLSCSDDNEKNTDNEPLELTDNIEVYESQLVEKELVFAIENGGTESYLIDKTGKKVKQWSLNTNLGNDLEILPDGRLIGIFKADNPDFSFGGGGGIVKILSKEGNVEWEYEYASSEHLSHHDVEMLPNGNVLFLVWERIPVQEAKAAGANTDIDIYTEALIEINPQTNNIVWEWHSFDHIVQDEFPQITQTYGQLNQKPELININYNIQQSNGDIMHANGIDYDENKDIIYISVNFYNEVWVIDHSTTTQEASTNIGGNYNKGGNLLYRFGNPNTYKSNFGTQLFDRNHFPNLLEGDEPGAGNVLVYSNGNTSEQSTVYELKIPDPLELKIDADNEPSIVWDFTDPNLFFGKISGAVRLKNGNTLICEGDYGFWEVTPDKKIAWKYKGDRGNFWRAYGYTWDSDAIKSLGLEQ